jgi:hypothetical protein
MANPPMLAYIIEHINIELSNDNQNFRVEALIEQGDTVLVTVKVNHAPNDFRIIDVLARGNATKAYDYALVLLRLLTSDTDCFGDKV